MIRTADDVLWQVDDVALRFCDIASALAERDGVKLQFGRRIPVSDQPGAWVVRPTDPISISAQTARNLRHLLIRVIADAETIAGA